MSAFCEYKQQWCIIGTFLIKKQISHGVIFAHLYKKDYCVSQIEYETAHLSNQEGGTDKTLQVEIH
jgi:hypothetical protein